MLRRVVRAATLGLALVLARHPTPVSARAPETVHFPSADGKTTLVGYLFVPESAGIRPAIILLHGRGGAYSSLAHGVYNATTLSNRHLAWSEFWEQRGYVALIVDSFGPRGYAGGCPRNSYSKRPPEVSEQNVRPLDAYGALAYLRRRNDVVQDRVGIQGWSQGRRRSARGRDVRRRGARLRRSGHDQAKSRGESSGDRRRAGARRTILPRPPDAAVTPRPQ